MSDLFHLRPHAAPLSTLGGTAGRSGCAPDFSTNMWAEHILVSSVHAAAGLSRLTRWPRSSFRPAGDGKDDFAEIIASANGISAERLGAGVESNVA